MASIWWFNIKYRETKGDQVVERLKGLRYDFEIEYAPVGNEFAFEIIAIHRETGRYSCINHLNTILSWFEVDEDDPLLNEDEWVIPKMMIESLSDSYTVGYLEDRLDEDRGFGEWANQLDGPTPLKLLER
jgi:hypothetical protein